MISFSTICGINGTFYNKFEHNLCIIKINKCLVAENILMNVTKMNKHLNVTTFVHALICISVCMRVCGACVHACVRACMRACMRVCVCVCGYLFI